MGRLPEQTGANLQTLNGLRQQLESTNTALRGEQDRLSMIERQLEAMRQGAEGLPLRAGRRRGARRRREPACATLEQAAGRRRA